jgi:phosphoglycerate-specific signal transduction histidine kinase
MFKIVLVVLMVICFLIPGYCDTVVVSKVNDEQVKIVTTTEQTVKIQDLVDLEKKITENKVKFDADYKQKAAQLDNILKELRDKIKKAEQAGVKAKVKKAKQ